MFSSLKHKILTIRLVDVEALVLLGLSSLPSFFMSLWGKDVWLFCERQQIADDNAWIFFNWMRKNHPEQKCFFVLSRKSKLFDHKDKSLITWGSFRHYVYYWMSKVYVKATFDSPEPNSRVCYYTNLLFKKNLKQMYLRHGISKDGCEYHMYKELKVRLFICGAKREYEYFLQNADYPQGYLAYTGLARYDDLYNAPRDCDSILIIPTWRRYLYVAGKTEEENRKIFLKSTFYKQYMDLLNSFELQKFLEENSLRVKFYLHAKFDKYRDLFTTKNSKIEIVSLSESVHQLLMNAGLVITDYSSVFFDVAYMKKPTVYFHFDYDEFRQKHLSEGYFNYLKDGFGPIVTNVSGLIEEIKHRFVNNYFVMERKFEERVDSFFERRDANNCERIYLAMRDALN